MIAAEASSTELTGLTGVAVASVSSIVGRATVTVPVAICADPLTTLELKIFHCV